MRQNKIWTVTLLTLLLSALSLAAPRVALVKINKGSAQLDGKAFKVAQMANEGQVLTVDAGSEVRIQLLGSSSEMTVSGPKKVNIQKAALASQAEKVTRGGLAVTLDIGNRNTAGALVTRGSSKSPEKARLKAIRPGLPPVKREGAYFLDWDSNSDITLPDNIEVRVAIVPQDENVGDPIEASFTGSLPVLELPPDAVEPGEGYDFNLTVTQDEGLLVRYNQSFRILNSDQQSLLQGAKDEMLERYNEEKSVLPLLRLASLYQALDQNREVLKYLEVALRSPYLKENDVELKTKLEDMVTQFRKGLDMTIPVID